MVQLLDQAARCLVPGGALVVKVPKAISAYGSMKRCRNITHQVALTPSSVRQLVKLCGFADSAFREWGPQPHGLISTVRFVLGARHQSSHRISAVGADRIGQWRGLHGGHAVQVKIWLRPQHSRRHQKLFPKSSKPAADFSRDATNGSSRTNSVLPDSRFFPPRSMSWRVLGS